jgi:hypothetical protein
VSTQCARTQPHKQCAARTSTASSVSPRSARSRVHSMCFSMLSRMASFAARCAAQQASGYDEAPRVPPCARERERAHLANFRQVGARELVRVRRKEAQVHVPVARLRECPQRGPRVHSLVDWGLPQHRLEDAQARLEIRHRDEDELHISTQHHHASWPPIPHRDANLVEAPRAHDGRVQDVLCATTRTMLQTKLSPRAPRAPAGSSRRSQKCSSSPQPTDDTKLVTPQHTTAAQPPSNNRTPSISVRS